MNRFALIFLCCLLLLGGGSSSAQSRLRAKKQKKAEAKVEMEEPKDDRALTWQERIFMEFYVEPQGDTVFLEELPAAVVFPRINRNSNNPDIRKYARLVYNFNKVYPYTFVARSLIEEADKAIAENKMTRLQKERYINKIQDDILDNFTDVVKHMTVSQGKLLVRLVDRETQMTAYEIIKSYKNGVAAGFWQGVAKLFDQSLKTPYDPEGEDRMTEYLIGKWKQGQFEALYYSVFNEWPTMVEIPSKYANR